MAEQSQKKSGRTMKIVWISLGILLAMSLVFAGVVMAHEGKGRYFRGAKGYSSFLDKDTVEKFDADKDGSLTREEFVNGMLGLHTEHVGLMFSRLDGDKNDVLSPEEMQKWVDRDDRKKRKGRKGKKGRYDDDHYDDDHHDDDDHYDDDHYDDDDDHRRKRRRR